MKKTKLHTRSTILLADTLTPVGIYLKLRDRFANSLLLESSDYHGSDNSLSIICCSSLATFIATEEEVRITTLNSKEEGELKDLRKQLADFAQSFEYSGESQQLETGLFGYLSYDSITHLGDGLAETDGEIPLAHYSLFQFIIIFNHFNNECRVVETYIEKPDDSLFEEVMSLAQQTSLPKFTFQTDSTIESNKTDDEFKEMVRKGIEHCQLGDVFQVVLSRKFKTSYLGDDFQVYRALRSINPSPYLFYYDYGNFKLFGSSPEAQLILKDGRAVICPIAGTVKRTGNDQADAELADKLSKDEKENAEHVMLVDLARNDLSRSCTDVAVTTYKEVQFYSHVIHLVSQVEGTVNGTESFMDVVAESFPAGTLSGAPKIKAMELIQQYEGEPRGYYGGAVGFMDFQGNFNHAIMIRSFMSRNNELHFQAGAGVVSKSTPEGELNEVSNKIGALEKAIERAENL